MHRIAKLSCLAIGCAALISAQKLDPPVPEPRAGEPVRMVITMGHNYAAATDTGRNAVMLKPTDLTVTHVIDPLAILNLTPLRGDHGALELFVVVDNCSSCEVGSKFDEIRKFLNTRPASTEIGVAYIQDGRLEIALPPTRDRDRAVRALNTPAGSKPSNPFHALTELIKSWPADSARHAVLMISNGIDPTATPGAPNKPAEEALEMAQRAGVIVYTIYHPAADYASTEFSQLYGGQIQLAHVSNETGGEAYLLGAGPLPSLAPFLSDIADHLANQYLLEFIANPEEGNGGFQDINVKAKNRDLEIVAPARVWVPGLGASDLRRLIGRH